MVSFRTASMLSALSALCLQAAVVHGDPAPEPLPEKLVVLTFDDAVRSHLTVVAPLLKRHGFGATFFVCHGWMPDHENFLDWEEVAKLHQMGFEVGNHTWDHAALHEEDGASLAREQTEKVESALAEEGVPRCVSVGWPGSHFGPEAVAELRRLGYRFGRRGMQPGMEADGGPLYEPGKHDPLLIPTTGSAGPAWTLDHLRAAVDRVSRGKIAVLMFHGVPDGAHPFCSTPPERFEEFMDYLDKEGFTVIALRDLERYITPGPVPEDPAATTRFFR